MCSVYRFCLFLRFWNWILELFRQRGSFCFSIRFWNCSDSVVVFVFLLDFGTVPTAWYFLFFYYILELFRQRGIFCFSIRFWKCFGSADRSALSPPAPPCDLECFIKIIPFLHCYSTQIHKSTVIMTRYPLFY